MFNTILAKVTNTIGTIKEAIKKITYKVIPVSMACMFALCAFGCAATNEASATNQLSSTETIEIMNEIEIDNIDLSQFEFENWAALCDYESEPELRQSLDSVFNTKTVKVKSETTGNIEDSKNGVLYVDYQTGNHLGNNTLYSVFMNSKFRNDYFNKSGSRYTDLLKSSDDYFIDLEVNTGVDEDLVYGALSGYFNILDDNNEKLFNADRIISRKEAYANVYKATNQYDKEIIKDIDLANVEDELDILATKESTNGLISTEAQDKAMTSGEFLYLLMNKYYSLDEVTVADTIKVYKTSGDIYTDITESSSNLSKGTPEAIAKAITLASEKGIINSDSYDWSASLTKHEFFDLLTKTFMKQTPKIDKASGLFKDASAEKQDLEMNYDAEEVVEDEPEVTPETVEVSESAKESSTGDETYKQYIKPEQFDILMRYFDNLDELNTYIHDGKEIGATDEEIKQAIQETCDWQLKHEEQLRQIDEYNKETERLHNERIKKQQQQSSTTTQSTPPVDTSNQQSSRGFDDSLPGNDVTDNSGTIY